MRHIWQGDTFHFHMLSILGEKKKKREWVTPTEATAQPHYLSEYTTHGTCHHLPKVSVLRACYLAAVHETSGKPSTVKAFNAKQSTCSTPIKGISISVKTQSGFHLPLDVQSPKRNRLQTNMPVFFKYPEGTKHRLLHIPKEKKNKS